MYIDKRGVMMYKTIAINNEYITYKQKMDAAIKDNNIDDIVKFARIIQDFEAYNKKDIKDVL
tara:strand:- start:1225 stop:1410 length:186 start_codon:yes stop_codon:yes gene_type:complete